MISRSAYRAALSKIQTNVRKMRYHHRSGSAYAPVPGRRNLALPRSPEGDARPARRRPMGQDVAATSGPGGRPRLQRGLVGPPPRFGRRILPSVLLRSTRAAGGSTPMTWWRWHRARREPDALLLPRDLPPDAEIELTPRWAPRQAPGHGMDGRRLPPALTVCGGGEVRPRGRVHEERPPCVQRARSAPAAVRGLRVRRPA